MPSICAKHYRWCDEKGFCIQCKGRPERYTDIRIISKDKMKKVS